ncbi:hypothetical protein ACFC6L_13665 [Kitasatospora phosalacinea]|uniref:hypothetical protein n=1 Tax=Kitasatospora phosalacinea TaxID=2065 RepID=UPI0035DDE3A5
MPTATGADQDAGFVFLLCWGIAAFSIGCVLAFDLRGARGRFAAFLAAQRAQSGRTAPLRGASVLRPLGAAFVLAGAGAAVFGAAEVFSVDADSLFARNQVLGALPLAFTLFGLLAPAGLWHRRGPLRAAWATGRATVRTGALLCSLAVLALTACLALGLFTLGAFVLALTVATAAVTLLSLPRRSPAT